jgi:hypothetical protein
MNSIYEAVRDSVPWDVTCVRTKHTVSIHCEFFHTIHWNADHIRHPLQVNTLTVRFKSSCACINLQQRFSLASMWMRLVVLMMVNKSLVRTFFEIYVRQAIVFGPVQEQS